MSRRMTFEDAARFVLGRMREPERRARPTPSLPRFKCLEKPMPPDHELASARKKSQPGRPGKAQRPPPSILKTR